MQMHISWFKTNECNGEENIRIVMGCSKCEQREGRKRRGKEGKKHKKACCVQGCPLDGAADGQESKRRESQPAGSSFSRTFKDQSPAHNKKGKKRRDPMKQKSSRALPVIKLELPSH